MLKTSRIAYRVQRVPLRDAPYARRCFAAKQQKIGPIRHDLTIKEAGPIPGLA